MKLKKKKLNFFLGNWNQKPVSFGNIIRLQFKQKIIRLQFKQKISRTVQTEDKQKSKIKPSAGGEVRKNKKLGLSQGACKKHISLD